MTNWPRPPRRVRMSTAFATFSPFGPVVAWILVVATIGGVSQWSGDGFRSPRSDWRLDVADARLTAMATITGVVREKDGNWQKSDFALCTFRFVDEQRIARTATSWLRAELLREGDHRGAEYLRDDPTVARLVDGLVARTSGWLPWVASYVYLPLLLAFGFWLSRVHRTYVVLRNGIATTAHIVAVHCPAPARGKKARGAQRCSVTYRYRGNDGKDRVATQRPRLGSDLGAVLQEAQPGEDLKAGCAVFAEWAPDHVRLVAVREVEEDTRS